MDYVCGFAFNESRNLVKLIEKQKPDYLKGKYTGVGGKVEPNEDIFTAICREFLEEAGVETEITQWNLFSSYIVPGSHRIYFFETTLSEKQWDSVRTMEAEQIDTICVSDRSMECFVPHYTTIPTPRNVRWLIPMALDPYVISSNVEGSIETKVQKITSV